MEEALKFTFKRHPTPTGQSSVAHPYADVDIKLGGKVVGLISAPSAFTGHKWRLQFIVAADAQQHACGWRWITLKIQRETEKEMRSFITKNAAKIQETFALHPLIVHEPETANEEHERSDTPPDNDFYVSQKASKMHMRFFGLSGKGKAPCSIVTSTTSDSPSP